MKGDAVVCGNKDTFAIECHIRFETGTRARNIAGSLWFWIGGAEVGNKDVISLPGIVANEIRQTLAWCGRRSDPSLYEADTSTVLDRVERGLYDRSGADSDDVQRWARFLICMLPGGHEYIDGWFTLMVEGESDSLDDRILYRKHAIKDREVWVPRGTYGSVARRFIDWFNSRDIVQSE